ncbi:metallophosphoesterase family protein [Thalassobacillus sp. CUG 92003]|uniref:metallophosphoesterase family protein n=1 Tax=Thalassobacillus sp. CUG 92003 TaxID=2736641 RepID=UPI0015E7203F|nr:metallophosphoesterase [Thalassobacillus sp. CUG 92003]
MKLVVIADTHMPKKASSLPQRLLEELPTADLIIHAGDWQEKWVHEKLSHYGEVVGVYGNVDDEELHTQLPEHTIIEAGGFRIGLTHGHGDKKTTEKRVLEAFEGEELDCIIFGHSHLPLLRFVKKTMLFNPGSITDKRGLPFCSFGILTIDETIQAHHIFF